MSLSQDSLELVLLGDDVDAAREIASTPGAFVYVDERDVELPWRTFVRVVAADLDPFAAVSALGAYVCLRRLEKDRPEGASTHPAVVTVNAVFRRPDLTHGQMDEAWRVVHAALARRHHVGIAKYEQLSVVSTLAGAPYDGFALLEFDDPDDLRLRFYDGPEGRDAIAGDIVKWADMERSPRRLVAELVTRPA
jgi:hypothetical protein